MGFFRSSGRFQKARKPDQVGCRTRHPDSRGLIAPRFPNRRQLLPDATADQSSRVEPLGAMRYVYKIVPYENIRADVALNDFMGPYRWRAATFRGPSIHHHACSYSTGDMGLTMC